VPHVNSQPERLKDTFAAETKMQDKNIQVSKEVSEVHDPCSCTKAVGYDKPTETCAFYLAGYM
jgi:hypothetical protein